MTNEVSAKSMREPAAPGRRCTARRSRPCRPSRGRCGSTCGRPGSSAGGSRPGRTPAAGPPRCSARTIERIPPTPTRPCGLVLAQQHHERELALADLLAGHERQPVAGRAEHELERPVVHERRRPAARDRRPRRRCGSCARGRPRRRRARRRRTTPSRGRCRRHAGRRSNELLGDLVDACRCRRPCRCSRTSAVCRSCGPSSSARRWPARRARACRRSRRGRRSPWCPRCRAGRPRCSRRAARCSGARDQKSSAQHLHAGRSGGEDDLRAVERRLELGAILRLAGVEAELLGGVQATRAAIGAVVVEQVGRQGGDGDLAALLLQQDRGAQPDGAEAEHDRPLAVEVVALGDAARSSSPRSCCSRWSRASPRP